MGPKATNYSPKLFGDSERHPIQDDVVGIKRLRKIDDSLTAVNPLKPNQPRPAYQVSELENALDIENLLKIGKPSETELS